MFETSRLVIHPISTSDLLFDYATIIKLFVFHLTSLYINFKTTIIYVNPECNICEEFKPKRKGPMDKHIA
jgi:hypothetical protein